MYTYIRIYWRRVVVIASVHILCVIAYGTANNRGCGWPPLLTSRREAETCRAKFVFISFIRAYMNSYLLYFIPGSISRRNVKVYVMHIIYERRSPPLRWAPCKLMQQARVFYNKQQQQQAFVKDKNICITVDNCARTHTHNRRMTTFYKYNTIIVNEKSVKTDKRDHTKFCVQPDYYIMYRLHLKI